MSHFPRRLLPASALLAAVALTLPSGAAFAAQPPVGLGTAAPFAVLAGSAVTNTGPTQISGSLGVSPGTAVTGFPPGLVGNGTIHSADAVALKAKKDLVTAYNDAAGRGPVVDETDKDLGGQTLTPGVYSASTSMGLTGTVTLDAKGDPDAVFIFQAGSTLITASSSRVALIGAAQPCNVWWQVGSSATIGTSTRFVGTVMALTSISLNNGATVQGRMLARNGAVTMDNNVINRPGCSTGPTNPSPTASPTSNPTTGSTPGTPTFTSGAGGGDSSGGGSGSGTGSGSGSGDDGTSGGSGSDGSGSSGGSGSAGSGSGAFIPSGHPETGRPLDQRLPSNAWLGLALACFVGAGAAATRGSRGAARSAHRR